MEKTKTYKELLELFEIPLLQAAKKRFKSQVKMADNLDINRNTLRKKILQYGLDNA
jgi:DNA-binding protein Fis